MYWGGGCAADLVAAPLRGATAAGTAGARDIGIRLRREPARGAAGSMPSRAAYGGGVDLFADRRERGCRRADGGFVVDHPRPNSAPRARRELPSGRRCNGIGDARHVEDEDDTIGGRQAQGCPAEGLVAQVLSEYCTVPVSSAGTRSNRSGREAEIRTLGDAAAWRRERAGARDEDVEPELTSTSAHGRFELCARRAFRLGRRGRRAAGKSARSGRRR